MPMILGVGIDWTSHEATPIFQPGTLAMDPDTFKIYKYLQFDDGSANLAITTGRAVVYLGDDGYDNYVVTRDFSDGRGICAGVAACESGGVVDNQDYIWVQVSGQVTMADAIGGAGAADGHAVTVVGAGDGAVTQCTAVTEHVMGHCIDESAQKVVLCCPL